MAGPSLAGLPSACSGLMNAACRDRSGLGGGDICHQRRLEKTFPVFARIVRTIEALGQSPVHDKRFTVRAQHHVGRFQVTVQNTPAVRVGDCVADVDQSPQQGPQCELHAPGSRTKGLPSWNSSIASFKVLPLMNRMA